MKNKPLSAIEQENAQLRQMVQQLQQLLLQRAEPQLNAVTDALGHVANLAAQGHPGARQSIANWNRAIEAARMADAGLIIPSVGKNGN